MLRRPEFMMSQMQGWLQGEKAAGTVAVAEGD
jgi:hypothetical protein